MMNLIDGILNGEFLHIIFPDGLKEDVYVGHLGLDPGADFSLNIHVKQKPNREIAKWGVWGENYDTIVIALLGTRIDDIQISGWKNIDFQKINYTYDNERYRLESEGMEWKIQFTFQTLTFQQCRTYM